jgi:hypothetical protein
MKHYQDFAVTGLSFRERIGDPTEFDAGIGRIAIGFTDLEDSVRRELVLFSGTDSRKGQLLFSGLSFRQKLEALDGLIRDYLERQPTTDPELDEVRRELIQSCRRAEELRNTYLHSSYGLPDGLEQQEHLNAYMEGRLRRAKSSTRGGTLRVLNVEVNPALLLDVADFIVHAAVSLSEAPMIFGLADHLRGVGWTTEYVKNGTVIARFDFPD